MSSPQIERKLAAIMFTDIVGYTALSAKDENKALALLDKQEQILTPIIEEFNGILHNKAGDGLLFTFSTVTDAVKCGIKIQKQIEAVEDLNLRIGIHEGEITLKDGDVLGDDVNIASRIEPFSAVGGIAISGKVQQNISSLPEFETTYVGTPKLKGVAQKVEVYCITSHGLPKTDISKVTAKLEDKSNFNIYTLSGGILTAIGIAFWIAVGVFDVSFGGKTEVPSIAIIPFDNKGAVEDAFYAYSISSELISDITSAGLIRVAGLKDIEKLEYQTLNYNELSEELLVRYIAQGTLWKVDSVFQLSMELYDTKTSKILWSENWQREWDELTSIKGNLAENILKTLKVSTKQDIAKEPTPNTEAYEYYLRANYIYDKRENMKDTEIARGLYQKAIELDDNLIKAKNSLGLTYYDTGDYDKAMEIYTSTLEQAEELGDKSGIGYSLNNIGNVYRIKSDYEKALEYFARSLLITEESGDKYGIGYSLGSIGIVYYYKGDYQKALDYYERSLAIKEELGDKRGMKKFLINIGTVHRNKGDYDKALDYVERSREIREELGDKRGMGKSLNNIGGAHKKKGEYEKRLDASDRELTIKEQIGDKRGMAQSLNGIGIMHRSKGDYDKALDYYGRSLAILEDIGDKRLMGHSLNSIGLVHSTKEDYDTALDYLGRSFAIFEEIGVRRGMVQSLFNIGLVYYDKGNYEQAVDYLVKSLAMQKEIGLEGLDLYTIIYLHLTYKHLGKDYDEKEIHALIKEEENIEFELNLRLYELLEDTSYLETAYNQVQEKASAMDDGAKFLELRIPKAIVEEWEKVK